jgi:putative ABC transport system substrate-binding protein
MRLNWFAIAFALSVTLAPVAGEAQPQTPRIGIVHNGRPTPLPAELEAFRRGLQELGWIEGQAVTIEHRWAEGNASRLPALVADLVRLKVDVLVVTGSQAIRVAKEATSTIPVVFVVLVDPVASGFVKSFARPGGNMTGLASQFEELVTKQPQLLKEALPNVSRLALLYRADAPKFFSAAEKAARDVGFSVLPLKVTDAPDYENAFKTAQRERAGAIVVMPSPFFNAYRGRLIELAAKYRLPAIYEFKDYVRDGGLMSYGPNISEMFRNSARYVDRILKGSKPGDLPIERPAIFELVINLKTAKALGITIAPSVLGRADEVVN